MVELTLREELLRGEDSTRQFKRELTSASAIAAELVAFLNSNGGRIFVGVEDNGSICGVPSAKLDAQSQLIANACTQNLTPPTGVLTENVLTSEGLVIVVTVEEGADKPYQTSDGSFFVKRGADKRRVTNRSELQRMFQAAHTVYAEARPVTGSSLADLDASAYAAFHRAKYKTEPAADESELLRTLNNSRLAKGDELTIAGLLLFGREPQRLLPEFTVKAVWFAGNERSGSTFVDNRRFDGNLAALYEQSMGFLRRWNRRVQNGGSFNGPTTDEVPDIVFEELVTNALIHRDYFIPDCIKLFIFDNRIEIRSPGRLPNSLTIEQMLRGIRRGRNAVIESFADAVLNYRGVGSGVLRSLEAAPGIRFEEDFSAEELVVTIPVT